MKQKDQVENIRFLIEVTPYFIRVIISSESFNKEFFYGKEEKDQENK
ncbi:hypothetical protein [Liquorilactobacillus satsumensis]|nr:hypothetical protein [Liquorilactobacillus satsumensis]MCP9356494.1 hypothetical protein [Liquorilactobacillus satsumensis]MCP9370367.1 hypothetical protein [Liquorilactobacillus satsumensis]